MNVQRTLVSLLLLSFVGLRAEWKVEDTEMQMEVSDTEQVTREPEKRDEWAVYKQGHSLVLYIKHGPSGKDRCAKLRLDELNEYLDRATTPEDEENYTFVNQGDFAPKGTKLISLLPEGQGDRCDFSESEVGADDEKYSYVIVIMPQKRFPEKYFILMLDGCYKVKAAIVVPNK